MGHGVPPTGRLVARGVRPSLSIDVVSSVPGEMFTQMRTALVQERILAFTETPDTAFAPTLTHRDVLEFATIDGARACALDQKIGTITPGKQADIILDSHGPGKRGAGDRPGGNRRHLRRHVECRHRVRGRSHREAEWPACTCRPPSLLQRLDAARDHLLSKAGMIPQWVLSRRD